MDESRVFNYTYSAAENKELREIRNKYLPKEESKLEELKRLDQEVETAGMVPALSLGIGGFLLFGLGVCMAARILDASVLFGVLLALLGSVGMILAYPVYRLFFEKTKEKLVPRILALTEDLDDTV